MKNIGILAVALVAALVLGFGARISNQTAHAQVTGTVVISCEFLIASVDGDVNDVPVAADVTAACDGLTAVDIRAIGPVYQETHRYKGMGMAVRIWRALKAYF